MPWIGLVFKYIPLNHLLGDAVYYSEFSRIKRMQRMLERIAYVSVGTDFLIAVSTYMAIN